MWQLIKNPVYQYNTRIVGFPLFAFVLLTMPFIRVRATKLHTKISGSLVSRVAGEMELGRDTKGIELVKVKG